MSVCLCAALGDCNNKYAFLTCERTVDANSTPANVCKRKKWTFREIVNSSICLFFYLIEIVDVSYVRISPNIFHFEHSTGSKCSENNCNRHKISNSGQKQALYLRGQLQRQRQTGEYSMKKIIVWNESVTRWFFVVSFLRRPRRNSDGSKQRKEFPFSR